MNRIIIIILVCVTVLCGLGCVMQYSSPGGGDGMERLWSQLRLLALGGACAIVAAFLPWEMLRRFQVPFWLLAGVVLLLGILVFPGVAESRNGAHRWLWFGQPSEVAKLALVIFLADYAARRQPGMEEPAQGFLVPLGVAALVAGLILIEPDWGTACLLGVVACGMMAAGGTKWRYLVLTAVLAAGVFLVLLHFSQVHRDRVQAFLHPEKYQHTIGAQTRQSVLAIGRGGRFGVGFGEGSQKLGYIPEQSTDFVFSLVGEELGFAGSSLVLGLYAAFYLCGMRISWLVTDPFGQFMALGLSLLVGVQALLNIAVVSGALPNKGICLPFVSAGGSSLTCMLIAVGLMVGVARRAGKGARPPSSRPGKGPSGKNREK